MVVSCVFRATENLEYSAPYARWEGLYDERASKQVLAFAQVYKSFWI